ncbi:MAG: TetR/AcrR family transcriptional regulator [Proteobacteria bacterium]|nr:TetR/AcrR family transcriptional regulator [Pseudomonadota bacterium]
MPKVSQAHRQMRQQQILEAAWRCFDRGGVQATTMQDIIAESGLSASAMYRYFEDKEALIVAAITASLGALGKLLQPIFDDVAIPGPAELATRIAQRVDAFVASPGYDLRAIAIQGWGEAQHNDDVRAAISGFYAGFRDRLAVRVRAWQKAGVVPRSARALDIANVIQAVVLGHVVQGAILGDVDAGRIVRGLDGF